jgi:hypothetical protein
MTPSKKALQKTEGPNADLILSQMTRFVCTINYVLLWNHAFRVAHAFGGVPGFHRWWFMSGLARNSQIVVPSGVLVFKLLAHSTTYRLEFSAQPIDEPYRRIRSNPTLWMSGRSSVESKPFRTRAQGS